MEVLKKIASTLLLLVLTVYTMSATIQLVAWLNVSGGTFGFILCPLVIILTLIISMFMWYNFIVRYLSIEKEKKYDHDD